MESDHLPDGLILTPEIAGIVERMRGRLSRERFLLTALKMLESGAVSAPPYASTDREADEPPPNGSKTPRPL